MSTVGMAASSPQALKPTGDIRMSATTTRQDSETRASLRLDSWKEIASYLKRGVRTVRRWERQEGLPVHRHSHSKQATVYAFVDELGEWLRGRSMKEGAGESSVLQAAHPSTSPGPNIGQKDRQVRP